MEFITENLTEILGIGFGVFGSVLVLVKSFSKQVGNVLSIVSSKSEKVDTDRIEKRLEQVEKMASELIEIMETDVSLKQYSKVVPDEYKEIYKHIIEKYNDTDEDE